jgi:hypothetical protein
MKSLAKALSKKNDQSSKYWGEDRAILNNIKIKSIF